MFALWMEFRPSEWLELLPPCWQKWLVDYIFLLNGWLYSSSTFFLQLLLSCVFSTSMSLKSHFICPPPLQTAVSRLLNLPPFDSSFIFWNKYSVCFLCFQNQFLFVCQRSETWKRCAGLTECSAMTQDSQNCFFVAWHPSFWYDPSFFF